MPDTQTELISNELNKYREILRLYGLIFATFFVLKPSIKYIEIDKEFLPERIQELSQENFPNVPHVLGLECNLNPKDSNWSDQIIVQMTKSPIDLIFRCLINKINGYINCGDVKAENIPNTINSICTQLIPLFYQYSLQYSSMLLNFYFSQMDESGNAIDNTIRDIPLLLTNIEDKNIPISYIEAVLELSHIVKKEYPDNTLEITDQKQATISQLIERYKTEKGLVA